MSPAISDTVREQINQPNHPLQDFAVIYEQPVEWGDMDAFGHVNNVVYYDYAQRARIHYLRQLNLFNATGYNVLAASSCQYLLPVVYPDTLLIGVRAKKIGNTSLTNEYVYFSQQQQAVVTTAESVIVFLDEQGKEKRNLTDGQKIAIEGLETKR